MSKSERQAAWELECEAMEAEHRAWHQARGHWDNKWRKDATKQG